MSHVPTSQPHPLLPSPHSLSQTVWFTSWVLSGSPFPHATVSRKYRSVSLSTCLASFFHMYIFACISNYLFVCLSQPVCHAVTYMYSMYKCDHLQSIPTSYVCPPLFTHTVTRGDSFWIWNNTTRTFVRTQHLLGKYSIENSNVSPLDHSMKI